MRFHIKMCIKLFVNLFFLISFYNDFFLNMIRCSMEYIRTLTAPAFINFLQTLSFSIKYIERHPNTTLFEEYRDKYVLFLSNYNIRKPITATGEKKICSLEKRTQFMFTGKKKNNSRKKRALVQNCDHTYDP